MFQLVLTYLFWCRRWFYQHIFRLVSRRLQAMWRFLVVIGRRSASLGLSHIPESPWVFLDFGGGMCVSFLCWFGALSQGVEITTRFLQVWSGIGVCIAQSRVSLRVRVSRTFYFLSARFIEG